MSCALVREVTQRLRACLYSLGVLRSFPADERLLRVSVDFSEILLRSLLVFPVPFIFGTPQSVSLRTLCPMPVDHSYGLAVELSLDFSNVWVSAQDLASGGGRTVPCCCCSTMLSPSLKLNHFVDPRPDPNGPRPNDRLPRIDAPCTPFADTQAPTVMIMAVFVRRGRRCGADVGTVSAEGGVRG